MRNPFRRRNDPTRGRSGLFDTGKRDSGAYTVETPDIGTGHYIFDPSASCSVHSNRLEAWCDIADLPIAQDELHWHCRTLSEFETPREEIREMGEEMIVSRRDKVTAAREAAYETEMARSEGIVESAPQLVAAELEERAKAEDREQALRDEAKEEASKLEGMRRDFDELPRRARIPIQFRLVLSVSISFVIFDVGVLGSAFELLSGELHWKIVLTAGVALAPVSTAIGIAQWLSAAELPIREDRSASKLALVAAALCVAGLMLIVLFRAAASGDPPIPPYAFSFLVFIQSSLAIAETMLYTVYFDGKVGLALRERIAGSEARMSRLRREADDEHGSAQSVQGKIGKIQTVAAEEKGLLNRAGDNLVKIREEEAGAAGVLKAIVDSAILEGRVAAAVRKKREAEEARKAKEAAHRPPIWSPRTAAIVGAIGGIALTAAVAGIPGL